MSQTKKVSQSYEKAGECVSELPCEHEFHTRKLKMKKAILLTVTALLLTACNFTIFGENDDEVVLEKRNITIVERNISIEELSGKWVIEDESIERYLKLSTRYLDKNELNTLKESLKLNYIYLYRNGTSKFRMNYYEEEKEYKGNASIESLKEWEKAKFGYFLYIPYKVDSWKSKDLYFLKLNNKFYLGEKFTRGEEETNSQRTYYLLYEKVEQIEVKNESN